MSFGKVSTSIWRSRKFRRLNDRAKLFYLYLHTCPVRNSIGCFVLPRGYMLADLDWPDSPIDSPTDSPIDSAIQDLSAVGLIGWDPAEEVVRIVGFLDHTPVTNSKHAWGCISAAAALPASVEKIAIINELMATRWVEASPAMQAALTAEIAAADSAIDRAIHSPMRTERYTERETERETETKNPPTSVVTPHVVTPQAPAEVAKPAAKAPQGTRLPADWTLPDEWRTAAEASCRKDGLPVPDLDRTATAFALWWQAKAGADARKADWRKTWIGWVRREGETIANRTGGRTEAAAGRAPPAGNAQAKRSEFERVCGPDSFAWTVTIAHKLRNSGQTALAAGLFHLIDTNPKGAVSLALDHAAAVGVPPLVP